MEDRSNPDQWEQDILYLIDGIQKGQFAGVQDRGAFRGETPEGFSARLATAYDGSWGLIRGTLFPPDGDESIDPKQRVSDAMWRLWALRHDEDRFKLAGFGFIFYFSEKPEQIVFDREASFNQNETLRQMESLCRDVELPPGVESSEHMALLLITYASTVFSTWFHFPEASKDVDEHYVQIGVRDLLTDGPPRLDN